MAGDVFTTDTSIFVRWFLKQDGWEIAQTYRDRFAAGKIGLQTVECARFELPHVLRTKGVLGGKMTKEEYRAAVRVIDDWDIEVAPFAADDLEACADLALLHNVRFFDAVFLHRAAVTDTVLLTADLPLANVAELVGIRVVRAVKPHP